MVSLSSQNIKQRSQTYLLAICKGCCFHAKFFVKLFNFPQNAGLFMVIWVKLAGALWIIGGKTRQLINILFCGYQRQSEI
jgi:hypothetical protein